MEAFDSGNYLSGSFTMPSVFNGALVTVQRSNDGTNWTDVKEIAVEVSKTYELPSEVFNARYGRLLAASSQTGGERTITVALKR